MALRFAELIGPEVASWLNSFVLTVQLFQIAVEARTPYSEELRRGLTISSAAIEHPPDVAVAHLIKRKNLDRSPIRTGWRPARMILAESVWAGRGFRWRVGLGGQIWGRKGMRLKRSYLVYDDTPSLP